MRFLDKVISRLKGYWMRFVLRAVHYSDNYKRLNMVYVVEDPWRLDSTRQRHRFKETNRIIEKNFGRIGSLLEIGCGEGHQSIYLQSICDRLIGIDVSSRAVVRARLKCPKGQFLVGDLFSLDINIEAPYDLVVACEVLYYIKDTQKALERLGLLGRHCLVTYVARDMKRLDPMVLSMPGVRSEVIEYENARWRVAYWKGNAG